MSAKGPSPEEALVQAIQNSDETTALALIDSGNVDVNHKDKKGFTPLVYAHRYRLQNVVKSLYEHHAIPTADQLSVMNKMCRIIFDIPGTNPYAGVGEIANHFPSMVIDPEETRLRKAISRNLFNGLCYGFSGLMPFMYNRGKGKDFNAILNDIVKWDGDANSLEEYPGLKEKLRQLFDNVYFLSLTSSSFSDEVLAKHLNDPTAPTIHKKDLDILVNLLLDSTETPYQKEFNFLFTFQHDELSNLFDQTIFDNKMVRLNFNQAHWVSIFKDESGYVFYDPEGTEGPVTLQTTQALADAVVASYQKYFSEVNQQYQQDTLYDIGLYAFDKTDAPKALYPDKIALLDSILQKRGPNNRIDDYAASNMYNALSLADVFHDEQLIDALLKHGAKTDTVNSLGFSMLSEETKARGKATGLKI